jgi:hypothetical protein
MNLDQKTQKQQGCHIWRVNTRDTTNSDLLQRMSKLHRPTFECFTSEGTREATKTCLDAHEGPGKKYNIFPELWSSYVACRSLSAPSTLRTLGLKETFSYS